MVAPVGSSGGTLVVLTPCGLDATVKILHFQGVTKMPIDIIYSERVGTFPLPI